MRPIKYLFIGLCVVLVSAVAGYTIYSAKRSFNPKSLKKPLVKEIPRHNKWLVPDFSRITEFYRSKHLHFNVKYLYFDNGGDIPVNSLSGSIWLSNGNYLFRSDLNEVMRNQSVSVMIDHGSNIIVVDSAWASNSFMPGGIDLESLISTYDSVTKRVVGDEFVYHIPSRGMGMKYTELTIDNSDFSIRNIVMYSDPLLSDTLITGKPPRIEIQFSNISTKPIDKIDLFDEHRYLVKGLPNPMPVSKYINYQIITNNSK